MAFAYTSTKTSVLVVGDRLTEQDAKLRQVADKMAELGTTYEKEIHRAGVQFEKTNDRKDLELMKYQWREVMPMIIGKSELSEVIRLLDELGGEPSQEMRRGMK